MEEKEKKTAGEGKRKGDLGWRGRAYMKNRQIDSQKYRKIKRQRQIKDSDVHKDKDRTRTKTKFTQCDDNKKRQRHHLEGKQTNAKTH